MRIVCVSDAHLDARTAGIERFDEIRESFEQAVRFAIDPAENGKPGADLFVFCGDLCDADDARDVLRASAYVCDAAVRLATRGVKSLWIAGNHDVVADGATTTLEPLRALEGMFDEEDGSGEARASRAPIVASMGPRDFSFEDCLILALPYSPVPYDADVHLRTAAKTAVIAGENLLVFGHLMLQGMHLGSESKEYARGKDRDFPIAAMKDARPELVVNGHYHQRQVTKDGIHIVGSLARLTFGEESNAPGFLVIDV